ncbi:MAG: HDOD domain-containing protein [Desulfobacterales bacterium]
MKPADLTAVMKQVDAFPGFPGSVTRLLRVLDDPEAPMDRIENILKLDAGLTANILKLSNSAYFGFQSRIGSVRKAVTLLGARRLRQLVLATCLNAFMDRPIPGYDLPSGELWRHSIAVSVAAEGLARELALRNDGEIFTAGLLHDIGKLVLGGFVRDGLGLIENLTASGLSFEAAERMALGADHAEVGARLLGNWSFPAELVHAVRWHHEPDRAEEAMLATDVVHAANTMCMMIGVGIGRDGLKHDISPATTRRLGLRPGIVEKVVSQTLQWMNETADAFRA